MHGLKTVCAFLFTSLLSLAVHAFTQTRIPRKNVNSILAMGLGDIFKNALANDPNLPPPVNPGLSKAPTSVEVEFLPSKKVIKAFLGQNIGMIAKDAKVEIKYSCKKGECGTCSVNLNGVIVKACQSSLPSSTKLTKFTIGILDKPPPRK